jgi:hypothetical protein
VLGRRDSRYKERKAADSNQSKEGRAQQRDLHQVKLALLQCNGRENDELHLPQDSENKSLLCRPSATQSKLLDHSKEPLTQRSKRKE